MEDIFEEFEKSKEIRPDDFHAVRKLAHEYVQKQSDQDTLRAVMRYLKIPEAQETSDVQNERGCS